MSLSGADSETLKVLLKNALGKVPPFLKSMMGPSSLNAILKSIPESFRTYTLAELIDALDLIIKEPDFKW